MFFSAPRLDPAVSLRLRRPLIVLCSCFAGALALAQSPGPAAEPAEEEVLSLSPFEVRATQDDVGYDASQSSTGTRVASDLIELPYAVNVVTRAFFEDFLAETIDEQFAYVSSFSAESDSDYAYTLRGFRTNVTLRDGYARSGIFNKTTTQRAEVIKGPAAAIYGRTQPGGIINYITRKPADKTSHQFTLAAGTDGYRRATFSDTGTVWKKDKTRVRYRIDADYFHEEYDQPGQVRPFLTSRVVSSVWDWHFNENRSRLQLSGDYTHNDSLPTTRAPILFKNLNTTQRRQGGKRHLGLAWDIADLGYDNLPGAGVERKMAGSNLTFEHRLSDHLNLRLGGDYADRRMEAREMYRETRRYDVDTHVLTSRQPQLRMGQEQFKSFQADLLASFWIRKTEHKLLFTADYYQQRGFTDIWRLDAVSVLDPDLNDNVGPGGVARAVENLPGLPLPDFVPGGTDAKGRPFLHSSDYDEKLITRGAFASWRMAAFKGKLITLLGGRYEETFYMRDNIKTTPRVTEFRNDGVTPTAGLNLYLLPQLTFFTNYSESYYPTTKTGFDDDGNAVPGGLPNEEGSGTDIGFKSRLFDGRLVFTTTYFRIVRKNVPYLTDGFAPGTDAAGVAPENRWATAGRIEGDGVEFDFSFKPFSRLNLFGAYSYNDTVVREAGYDLDLVGRRWERVPEQRAAVGFSFRAMRGLTFTGGYRYEGNTVFDNGSPERLFLPGTNVLEPTDARTGNDGQREMLNPSYTNVDLGVNYQWRDRRRWTQRVQFNVKNVLKNETFRQNGLIPPPRRFIVSYRITL